LRSKTELVKTASILKQFSDKIKQAQEGLPGIGGMNETLTPEAVQDIAMEIQQVAEVASQLATEIAEGVPAEEATPGLGEREEPEAEPGQISMAQEGEEDEDEKKKLTEQVASMKTELDQIKRAGLLEKLATKYASLFPKSLHEAKMNEILTSKQGMDIIQAKVQEASDIITSKTMIKVASMTNSIYDFEDEGGEIDISSKL
jgi:hypothetical protein